MQNRHTIWIKKIYEKNVINLQKRWLFILENWNIKYINIHNINYIVKNIYLEKIVYPNNTIYYLIEVHRV